MNSQSKENAANIRDGYSIVDYRHGIKEGTDQPNSVFLAAIQRQRVMEREENAVNDFKEADGDAFTKREQHSKAVSELVDSLSRLPASNERDAIAKHIIVVLKDNKITDGEYDALKNEMSELVAANSMKAISDKAKNLSADDGY